jgi:hypothetical protein
MRPWEKRSLEEANLLNPAFLTIISYQCIKGYTETVKAKAPYVLPRESLPRGVNTTFSTWVTQIQGSQAKIRYAERTRSIVPCVKEAVAFGLAHQLFALDGNSSLTISQNLRVPSRSNNNVTDEVADCFKKAYFCGRWIARAGKIETVMALLGVKP